MDQRALIAGLFFATLTVPLISTSVPAAQSTGAEVAVRGKYYNYGYAYSVIVPTGLTGVRSPAPLPNHGFGISLSNRPKSYVWVDGSYNAIEWKTFDEAISSHIGFVKEDGGADVQLINKSLTILASLRAVRFIIQYKAKDSNETMVQEVVLAFRKNSRDANMTYEIGLVAPESRYEQDRKVLVQMQRTWKLRRLP